MPSVPDGVVHTAVWPKSVAAEVGASIYALQPGSRVVGGQAAHAAGMWVHADIILRPDAGGGFANTGVDVSDVLDLLDATPEARVDLHLMVLGSEPGWEQWVDDIATRLQRAPIRRWSARDEILTRLQHMLPAHSQRWVEVGPRDAVSEVPRGGDGALVMLIEPGSKGTADPAAVDFIAKLSATGMLVGADGGVTPEVAEAAVAAVASHLVVGRALWVLET